MALVIPLSITASPQTVPLEVAESPTTIPLEMTINATSISGEPYTGAYTVTPSREETVLPTDGKIMLADVTVNPIPSNYGLITRVGAKLLIT